MPFGTGYESREYNRVVPEGDYMVTLGLPQDKVLAGYDVRVFPIKIDGFPDHKPDEWVVFDCPRDDIEKIAKWNEQRTREFDVFGVQRGDFRPSSWAGRRGMLHFEKDKKGYMKALWAVSEGQQKPSGAKTENVQDQTEAVPPNFPDNIPF